MVAKTPKSENRLKRHPGWVPRKAFTLVEVIIVVTVIAVVAAMAIRLAEPDTNSDLQSAAQIVMIDLDFARSLSATNASNYRVSFNRTTHSYSIRHQGTNANLNVLPTTAFHKVSDSGQQLDAALTDIPALGSVVQIQQVATGTFVSGGLGYVEFTPLGSTTNTETSIIWLTAGNGARQRYIPIRVNPITGLATIGTISLTAP